MCQHNGEQISREDAVVLQVQEKIYDISVELNALAVLNSNVTD